MGSNPGPYSTSLSFTNHWCSGFTPLALQEVQVRMKRNPCLFSPVPALPLHPIPALSLVPAHSHTCLSPSQTLSFLVAKTCGKRRREFHWGNLLNSHTPASARIFLLSLNLPRSVIPLLSPSICAGWPWESSASSLRCQHCLPSCVRAAWQRTWASPHPFCASVSPFV